MRERERLAVRPPLLTRLKMATQLLFFRRFNSRVRVVDFLRSISPLVKATSRLVDFSSKRKLMCMQKTNSTTPHARALENVGAVYSSSCFAFGRFVSHILAADGLRSDAPSKPTQAMLPRICAASARRTKLPRANACSNDSVVETVPCLRVAFTIGNKRIAKRHDP
jgi:hypothetical protein